MVEQLLKGIKERQLEILNSFITSPCADMAEYNRRIGQHMGLAQAEEELLYLIRPKGEDA